MWIAKVFLLSLPYKFSNHPDTQHIFSTIGLWLGDFFGLFVGRAFNNYGAYVIGSFELLTSIILLIPILLAILELCGIKKIKLKIGLKEINHHLLSALGGLMATFIMIGAVFFHVFSPLGIKVLHEGKSDGGSLFYSAVSIVILGLIIFFLNQNQSNHGR